MADRTTILGSLARRRGSPGSVALTPEQIEKGIEGAIRLLQTVPDDGGINYYNSMVNEIRQNEVLFNKAGIVTDATVQYIMRLAITDFLNRNNWRPWEPRIESDGKAIPINAMAIMRLYRKIYEHYAGHAIPTYQSLSDRDKQAVQSGEPVQGSAAGRDAGVLPAR